MIEFKAYHSSSAGNLYTVSNGISTLLIEAGLKLPAIKKALGFNLSTIRACIISHSHGDHSKGCSGLLQSEIDCYMTDHTARALKVSGHRLHIIEPLEQFRIGSWTIMPFPTIHDTPGSVGYLLESNGEKLLFLTDTHYCEYKFTGLNIIAIEVNWSAETMAKDLPKIVEDRIIENHMNLERALRFFKANDLSNVREIHLLHLSDANSDAELFKNRIQAATGRPVTIARK